MKALLITHIFFFLLIISHAQSIERDVVSTSGDYFEGTNASLSWTLGEISTETYSAAGVTLTQGFHQPSIFIHGINLDVLVFLEGPYQDGEMNTTLKDSELIPLSQPYNVEPWNYTGTENVISIPENVVDWVLVELRDAGSASTALQSTSLEKQAAFILSDGSVVGIDGSSSLQFTSIITNDPYIVVWHRNHLGILTANSPTESNGVYSYDFSTSAEQAYEGELGYKLIGTDVYGMVGGDANKDGTVDLLDIQLWENHVGTTDYIGTDASMDTQVNNIDKNDNIIENQGKSSKVPE